MFRLKSSSSQNRLSNAMIRLRIENNPLISLYGHPSSFVTSTEISVTDSNASAWDFFSVYQTITFYKSGFIDFFLVNSRRVTFYRPFTVQRDRRQPYGITRSVLSDFRSCAGPRNARMHRTFDTPAAVQTSYHYRRVVRFNHVTRVRDCIYKYYSALHGRARAFPPPRPPTPPHPIRPTRRMLVRRNIVITIIHRLSDNLLFLHYRYFVLVTQYRCYTTRVIVTFGRMCARAAPVQ